MLLLLLLHLRTSVYLQSSSNDSEDDDFVFTSEINIPRKQDLSPPAQSLTSLTMSSLEVIKHLTM